ncbi:MAG: hypothetical protein AAF092_07080 [Pseudomonadota bacterium]
MTRKPTEIFLNKSHYRRRRVADAARAVPVLGGMLVMLPLLWPPGGDGSDGGVSTVAAFLYIFGLWVVMILAAAVLSRWLVSAPED